MYLQGVLTFRLSSERAQRLFFEVDRAACRLEQLAEGRRERLRDLARVRALEVETTQVSSLLSCTTEYSLSLRNVCIQEMYIMVHVHTIGIRRVGIEVLYPEDGGSKFP
jgi:hypothetical protein